MTFRELILRHGGTVAFGYGLALCSSFGQTFFIALSGPGIRESFGLSHGGFGAIYSTATLCSGLLMIWAGGVLDRVSTEVYAAVAVGGLALAALGLSLAPGVAVVAVSLFALRLFGQGMLGHASVTSTARLPQAIRGRAIGIATLGFSTGEMLLPGLALAIIAAAGWASVWQVVASALTVAFGLVLAKAIRRRRTADTDPARRAAPASPSIPQRRRDVIRDWRFLVLIPSMIAPGAIGTGYFFHQRLIGEQVGWGLDEIALGFATYAGTALVSTMTAGMVVDRFRGVRVAPFYLVFLGLASLTLAFWPGGPPAMAFFALLAMTAAANSVVVPAVLAEIYGTEKLGTIRALAGAIMVVGSATTPVLFGVLFDAGVTVGAIGIASAAYVVVVSALNALLFRQPSVNPN